MKRTIPTLGDIPLSPSRYRRGKRVPGYGDEVRVRMLNIVPCLIIECYQRNTVDRPHRCNFVPSCSEYMRIAFLRYNCLIAMAMSYERMLHCGNPYSDWPRQNKP